MYGAGCEEAAADIDELADARSGRHEPHGALKEAPVLVGGRDSAGSHREQFSGSIAISWTAPPAAQQDVVNPRDARRPGRRFAAVISGSRSLSR